MKKLVSLVLAVCTCLFIGIMFTACDEDGSHEHAYGEWIEVDASTCSKKGKREKVCSCAEKITEEIEMLPHTEETVTGKDATCTETGLTDGKKCSVCQTVTLEQQVIGAKGHSFSDVIAHDAEYHWYPSTCGHSDEVKNKGEHVFENGECDICGRKQPTNTVEENEWKALFAGTNLTVSYESGYMSQSIKYDGNKQYDYMKYGDEGFGLYGEFVINEDESVTWYEYGESSFEGDWEKFFDEAGNGARMRAVLDTYFYPFGDTYSSFSYDSQNKQYTAERVTVTIDGSNYTYSNVCVKIENGKLLEVTYSYGASAFVINEVGTTVVTLPIITYTATEDEWNAIMTDDALYNVRVQVKSQTENGDYVNGYSLKFNENAFELENSYVVKQDGVWYYVSRDWEGDDYIGVVCSKDDYSLQGTIGAQLVNKYGSFTYDEENHCYLATNFAFGDDESCEELRIYIRNGKIVNIEQKTTATVSGSICTVINTYEFFSYGRVSEESAKVNLPEFSIR